MILSNPVKPDCVAPDVAFKGSMVYWYNSTSYRCSPEPQHSARPTPLLNRMQHQSSTPCSALSW